MYVGISWDGKCNTNMTDRKIVCQREKLEEEKKWCV